MKTFKYLNFNPRFAENLVNVGDIENDGDPMIVCYYDVATHRFYLAFWVDNEKNINRWIFIRVAPVAIINYMDCNLSVRNLIANRIGNECYLLDRENNCSNVFYLLEQFPEEYLSVENCFFEKEWCNEANIIRRFIEEASANKYALLPQIKFDVEEQYNFCIKENHDIIIDSSNRYALTYSNLV